MRPFANPHAPLISHQAAGQRLCITGELCLDLPLHIGSGQSSAQTDSAVVLDHNQRPLIPGSSLRGALRNRCERLADALLPGQICFLFDDTEGSVACVSIDPTLLQDDNDELLSEQELWGALPNFLCPSCRLFGASAYWASKVRIPDLALLSVPGKRPIKPVVRHGVGIHRDTQTAAPAIKYNQENVEPDARFKLEILLENPDNDDLSLLALGLNDLVQGRIALGGSSSRGLGECHVEKGRVAWVNLNNRQELIPFLMTAQYPHEQALEAWLQTQLQPWLEA